MAAANAISAHGTVLKFNGTPVNELRDVGAPQLMREITEVTRLSDRDERVKVGIKRNGVINFELNWVATDPTHLGLLTAWVNATEDTYELDFPDGAAWSFTGFVANIAPMSPVDGLQAARVTVRPAHGLSFSSFRATEAGDIRITEAGDLRVTE